MIEFDFGIMLILVYGNFFIIIVFILYRVILSSGILVVVMIIRSSVGCVDFRGYELMMFGVVIVGYKCFF